MFDPRRPVVQLGLNLGSLLSVGDLVLDEVPEFVGKRVSGIVQV